MLKWIQTILTVLSAFLFAQKCPEVFQPAPTCSHCDVYLGSNDNGKDVVIAPNQTACISSGVTVSPASLDIRQNAKLIVCGTLQMNNDINLNYNNSAIFVAPGGTISATNANMNLNANVHVYNYGNIYVGNLSINGNNASFNNIGYSTFLGVQNNIVVNGNSLFVNTQGIAQAQSFTLNGAAQACLSNGACLSVATFINNGNNAVVVTGNNPVVLHFTNNAVLNGVVTNSNLLYVCQDPNATVNNPSKWGSAQVYQNCTSGCSILSYKEKETYSAQHTQNKIYVYPNPFKDKLNYRYFGTLPATIRVYNELGVLIAEQTIYDHEGAILFDEYISDDVYIICFVSSKESHCRLVTKTN